MLHDNFIDFEPYEPQCSAPDEAFEFAARDSAVDLTTVWPGNIKQEPSEALAQFFDMHSPVPTTTRSPSADEPIFSTVNSPGDFLRDPSQTSSPETSDDVYAADSMSQTEAPKIFLVPDKTKTRAETQIKMQLVVDPLESIEFIRFPRKTLAKPKHFASEEEKLETESKGGVLTMDCMLVCATAVETPEQRRAALRRAAGKEKVQRRDLKIALSELDKDDPAHPQNGGEVLICDGCKERERKRYDRKKKRTEDEEEFSKYESERVVMINEKEYKKWKDVDLVDHQFSSRAKQVEFAMRIACYCRHQEEKTPMGYRVIFTFADAKGHFVAQHLSDVFHITDDHKNKEAPETMPRPLHIPQQYGMQYPHPSNVVVPMYQYPVENQYALGPYSQPQTPVMSNFQSPISPIETAFSQAPAPPMPQPLRHPAPAFPQAQVPNPTTTAAQYTRHQRGQSYFEAPMLSPTGPMPMANQIPRPQSFDNFNFNFTTETQMPHQSHDQYYASAPQSAVSTPLNLSRPASPTWEQGPQKKKTLRCVYFYVDDE
ncbi:hypothetical protein K458DRAFT_293231 [Lentithecium fluviatile CBS 122367]|uniref:SPT23/MGA2-like DNA-binding domain-containing protein n=1 Tax=Lentithecium fluviatile CBS 122367 TaxID=1168545 RepID=A0A6G1JF15_9PLEO|nr:hypothetical protein K458DRAFT_293231 [Lentithecium fluviatile CBS 122367]